MGTDCVSELESSGAYNCVSKSFPSSLSKQLINKTTNSVCGKEEERADVKVWIEGLIWLQRLLIKHVIGRHECWVWIIIHGGICANNDVHVKYLQYIHSSSVKVCQRVQSGPLNDFAKCKNCREVIHRDFCICSPEDPLWSVYFIANLHIWLFFIGFRIYFKHCHNVLILLYTKWMETFGGFVIYKLLGNGFTDPAFRRSKWAVKLS